MTLFMCLKFNKEINEDKLVIGGGDFEFEFKDKKIIRFRFDSGMKFVNDADNSFVLCVLSDEDNEELYDTLLHEQLFSVNKIVNWSYDGDDSVELISVEAMEFKKTRGISNIDIQIDTKYIKI